MQGNTGYDDSHFNRQAFKKKEAPIREIAARKVPVQSKPGLILGGKVILNDKLSMANKSKTASQLSELAGLGGVPLIPEPSELTDLMGASIHSEKSSKPSARSRQMPGDASMSTSQTGTKHGASQAETGARTSQTSSLGVAQKGQDFLTESGNSLKESLGLNEEVFEFVYERNSAGQDLEGLRHVARLQRQMDDVMADSITKEDIELDMKDQLETLEKLRLMVEEREKQKSDMQLKAAEFISKSKEVGDMPDDFDEVAERVADQVLEERRNRSTHELDHSLDDSLEDGELGESELMKMVRGKLLSTFYGFSKEAPTQETVKQALDDVYKSGIERIRELDKQLALREKEEKAIKDMIILNKQRERELAVQVRMSTPSNLSNNPSSVSVQSSKSDFFPTQPKRNVKNPAIQIDDRANDSTSGKSSLGLVKRPTKLPSRPASQQNLVDSKPQETVQISVDFVKKNIEDIYLSDHEKFMRNLKPEGQARYACLIKEIEEGLDSDDPLEFRRVSQLHYENAYGYPPELQEKFREIDERIVDMLAQEEKTNETKSKGKDVLRERVVKKENSKRLKQIDEQIERIRNEDLRLTPEQLEQTIKYEISIVDAATIQSIKDTIDLADFDDWEQLDEEAIELIKKVDVDSIEKYLNDCLTSIEETEKQLKIEEEQNKITDPEAIQRSVEFAEGYSKFLKEQKEFLDTFKIHDRISSEEDFEAYEEEVRAKLLQNGDMLDKWYYMMEEGREEIDRMCIEHEVLLKEVSQLPIRDPERFDEEVTAELRLKKPELFNKVYPVIEHTSDDDEDGLNQDEEQNANLAALGDQDTI